MYTINTCHVNTGDFSSHYFRLPNSLIFCFVFSADKCGEMDNWLTPALADTVCCLCNALTTVIFSGT